MENDERGQDEHDRSDLVSREEVLQWFAEHEAKFAEQLADLQKQVDRLFNRTALL